MPGFSDHYPAQSNHDVLKLINLHSLIFKGAIVSVQAVNEMKRLAVASGCVYSMKWKVSRCCAAQYSPGHWCWAGMEGEESPGPAPRYLIATIAHYFTLQTLIHNTTYLPTITSIPSADSTHGEVS